MTQPTAGWYSDPDGSGGFRYWSGSAWTELTAPAAAAAEMGLSDTKGGPDDAPFEPNASPSAAPEVPTAPVQQAPQPVQPQAYPGGQPYVGNPPIAAPVAPSGPQVAYGPDGQVLSGWWRRAGGYVIDGILSGIGALLGIFVFAIWQGGLSGVVDQTEVQELFDKIEANPGYQPSEQEFLDMMGPDIVLFGVVLAVCALIVSFLNGVVLVARSGQTVGDRVVQTRKVTPGRNLPTFSEAALRWSIIVALGYGQLVPLLGLPLFVLQMLDFLWPLRDKQNQTFHDKAVHTYVERADLAGPLPVKS